MKDNSLKACAFIVIGAMCILHTVTDSTFGLGVVSMFIGLCYLYAPAHEKRKYYKRLKDGVITYGIVVSAVCFSENSKSYSALVEYCTDFGETRIAYTTNLQVTDDSELEWNSLGKWVKIKVTSMESATALSGFYTYAGSWKYDPAVSEKPCYISTIYKDVYGHECEATIVETLPKIIAHRKAKDEESNWNASNLECPQKL